MADPYGHDQAACRAGGTVPCAGDDRDASTLNAGWAASMSSRLFAPKANRDTAFLPHLHTKATGREAQWRVPAGASHESGCDDRVIWDHLSLGVKTGLPYTRHSKASNLSVNLDYKGIFWHEDIIPFFQSATLSKECDTVQKCYISLSEQVREKIGKIDSYSVKLADVIVTWIEACDELNPSDDVTENGEAAK